MGRRNDDQLTASQQADADQALRLVLARHNQPKELAPPSDLAARIVQRLPAGAPAAAARAARRRAVSRRASAWASMVVLLALSLLGAWGVLINSGGPAMLFGGPETTLGYAALVVTLAAKPLIALIITLGVPAVLGGTTLVVAAGWMWWKLAVRPLEPVVVEQL